MTKEDILEYFKDINGAYNECTRYDDLSRMLDMLVQQEPCEDVISRDELLKAINTWDKFGYTETGCFVREPKNDCVKYIHYDDVIKCIKGMPPVTPQPKTGHWRKMVIVYDALSGEHKRVPYTVEDEKMGNVPVYNCDCGCNAAKPHNYCPDCGLKMEVER